MAAAANGFDAGSIHCWSGPRCVSTSLMYAFAQRTDCQVGGTPGGAWGGSSHH